MFYTGVNFKEHLSAYFLYYSLSPILILENKATKIFANVWSQFLGIVDPSHLLNGLV